MNLLWGILAIVLLLAWSVLYGQTSRRYPGAAKLEMDGIRLQRFAPPMLYVLERIQVSQRFPLFFFKIQRSVRQINGQQRGGEYTMLFLAEMLTYSYLPLIGGCLISIAMEGEASGFFIGVLLAVLLPVALISDLHGKVKRREQQILLELPELLNKIILLVGAGSTVQQAIKQCLERKRGQESHPLYRELFQMQRECEGGYSFAQAMEGFSKRCGIQEVSAFTTAVLLNFRRGGSDFVLALRDLSHSLWEKRKAVGKTLGEQASSKLVFPMVLLFLIIVVLVGTPAFMIMDL
ncbi:type II secretion system F family protein [Paenibacillus sp. YSY-4.3]